MTVFLQGYCVDVTVKKILPGRAIDFAATHESSRSEIFLRLKQHRLSGEVSYQASHDAVTELVNRAEFEVRLRRILQSTHGKEFQHALMYIDLDQFKVVNDTCGHSVSDQLQQQISQLFARKFVWKLPKPLPL